MSEQTATADEVRLDPNLTLAQLIEFSGRESFKAGLRIGVDGAPSPERQARLRAIDAAIAERLAASAAVQAVPTEKHSSLPEAAKLAWRALCDAEAVINTIDGEDCLETINLEELRGRIRDVATHLFVILRLPVSELSAPTEPVQRPGDHLPGGAA